MARYADHTPRSERMCSQPCPGVHEPQSQRVGKSDVSKSSVKKFTVNPLRARISERFNAPRGAFSRGATVDPRWASARTRTNNSQRPVSHRTQDADKTSYSGHVNAGRILAA